MTSKLQSRHDRNVGYQRISWELDVDRSRRA